MRGLEAGARGQAAVELGAVAVSLPQIVPRGAGRVLSTRPEVRSKRNALLLLTSSTALVAGVVVCARSLSFGRAEAALLVVRGLELAGLAPRRGRQGPPDCGNAHPTRRNLWSGAGMNKFFVVFVFPTFPLAQVRGFCGPSGTFAADREARLFSATGGESWGWRHPAPDYVCMWSEKRGDNSERLVRRKSAARVVSR